MTAVSVPTQTGILDPELGPPVGTREPGRSWSGRTKYLLGGVDRHLRHDGDPDRALDLGLVEDHRRGGRGAADLFPERAEHGQLPEALGLRE